MAKTNTGEYEEILAEWAGDVPTSVLNLPPTASQVIKVQEKKAVARGIFGKVSNPIFIVKCDHATRVFLAEPFNEAAKIFAEALGDDYQNRFSSAALDELLCKKRSNLRQEKGLDVVCGMRTYRFVIAGETSGGTSFIIGKDVTRNGRGDSEPLRFAFYDALTDLPNRALFTERLDRALMRLDPASPHLLAVITLNLIDFKQYNVAGGANAQNVGDLILKGVAERISGCLRSGDLCARLGGDEFGIFMDRITDPVDVMCMADRLQKALAEPFFARRQEIKVSARLGAAFNRDGGRDTESDGLLRGRGDGAVKPLDAQTLIAQAAQAMARYDAGTSDAAVEFYSQEMHRKVVERQSMKNDLAEAIRKRELTLVYQPIMGDPQCEDGNVYGGTLLGFEALVRWKRYGMSVPPDVFIALAEETGLIVPLGWLVLEESCRQIKIWNEDRARGEELYVSVNFSAHQLRQPGFFERFVQVLASRGIHASWLKAELTERVVMTDHVAVSAAQAMRDFGIKVMLDDFGTGYSSLSCLDTLPCDTIKIDGKFVREMGDGKPANSIVRAIIALARALGKDVVAECVEKERQYLTLAGFGCHAIQGYFVSKPLPPDDMPAFFQEFSS